MAGRFCRVHFFFLYMHQYLVLYCTPSLDSGQIGSPRSIKSLVWLPTQQADEQKIQASPVNFLYTHALMQYFPADPWRWSIVSKISTSYKAARLVSTIENLSFDRSYYHNYKGRYGRYKITVHFSESNSAFEQHEEADIYNVPGGGQRAGEGAIG